MVKKSLLMSSNGNYKRRKNLREYGSKLQKKKKEKMETLNMLLTMALNEVSCDCNVTGKLSAICLLFCRRADAQMAFVFEGRI